MVKCEWCNREMLEADGCVGEEIVFPDGVKMSPVLFGDEVDKWYSGQRETARCGDCACRVGYPHHPRCDVERCPKCGGQLISCGCLDEDDNDDNEE